MNLEYFEEPAYDRLKADIEKNFEKYSSDEEWLASYFESKKFYSISSVIVNNVQNLESKDFSTLPDIRKKEIDNINLQHDIINIRLIYDAFKNLTPLQAINKYMWSYLAHTKYSKYVRERWLYREQDKSSRINTIRTHYFVEGKDNLIVDNAISRLWWAGYLTYDENSSNKYHLTEILFSAQQISTDILDRRFAWNKKVMMGILLGLEKYKEKNVLKVDPVRQCIKYFGRYAAVTMVDELPINDISTIIYEYLINN